MGETMLPLLSKEEEEASEAWERELMRQGPQWDLVRRVVTWEWSNLWHLSWASVIIQLSMFMMGTVGMMFAGRLGTLELAGVSVIGVSVQSVGLGVTLGMANAVQTICGQAYGAKRYKTMGMTLQKAFMLHFIVSIFLGFMFYYSGTLLVVIGQAEEIAFMGQTYARGLIPQLLAVMLWSPMQRFLQAQNIVNPVAYICIAVLAVHILITWLTVVVFEVGILGVSLSFSVSCCLVTLFTWLYIINSTACRETWNGFSSEVFTHFWDYVKLALASTLITTLEMWYLPVVSLLSGYLSNPEIYLDAISICTNWWNWDFMIMFGLSNAASARIGMELGAGHPRLAKFSAIVAIITTIAISVVLSALVLVLRTPLAMLFTDNNNVITEVINLSHLIAISIILNGIHPMLSGVAVGSGWQDFAAYVNIISYYLIGLPIAYFLGFWTSLEVSGLIWGVVIGVLVQTIALSIKTAQTDWDKEVEKVEQRLMNTTRNEDYLIIDRTL
ncbi:Protein DETOXIFICATION [Rhynchospora pubera]|uniref:Protein DETOXIFICATION n=1 Tax=Rhynchospora pubera TaxID=906938 RepID=A0AAV8GLJ3_9POAL|nr:Protein DETOXIFICATION [Rhynchospora pubera]